MSRQDHKPARFLPDRCFCLLGFCDFLLQRIHVVEVESFVPVPNQANPYPRQKLQRRSRR